MLSKEAIKAKKKFQNLGTLIDLLSLNPKKLSKPKIISQRLNFNFIVPRLAKKHEGVVHEEVSLGTIRTLKVTSENSDPEKILDYINRSENASFSGQDKIRIETIENKVTERLNELEKILIEIGCHDE